MQPLQQLPPLNNSPISSNQEQVSLVQVVPSCSTILHLWFTQNVYPLITPKRILYFLLSHITFLLAYAAFTQTELYHSYINHYDHHHDNATHQIRPMLFLIAAFGIHTTCLIFFMFFSFIYVTFQKCRYHYLIKSLGEYLDKFFMVFLMLQIAINHYMVQAAQLCQAAPSPKPVSMNHNYSQLAALATVCFLTIDAFSIVALLEPSHHYTLLESTLTLTLHLGLTMAPNYFRVPSAVFVFVIVVVKNYVWRDTDQPQPSLADEPVPVAWVPSWLV